MALGILKITKIDACLLGILTVNLAYPSKEEPNYRIIEVQNPCNESC